MPGNVPHVVARKSNFRRLDSTLEALLKKEVYCLCIIWIGTTTNHRISRWIGQMSGLRSRVLTLNIYFATKDTCRAVYEKVYKCRFESFVFDREFIDKYQYMHIVTITG